MPTTRSDNVAPTDAVSAALEVSECLPLLRKRTIAVWTGELSLARVLNPAGKQVCNLGVTVAKATHLYPEEAVSLADQGALDLHASAEDLHALGIEPRGAFVGDVPGPSAAALPTSVPPLLNAVGRRALLLASGVLPSVYEAYAHLRSQGLAVYRHGTWRAPREVLGAPHMHSTVAEAGAAIRIAFDVYASGRKLARTRLPTPDYCVALCAFSDGAVPPVRALQAALMACAPSQLRLGITEGTQTVFIDVETFVPPTACNAEARPKKRVKGDKNQGCAVASSSAGAAEVATHSVEDR